jgi:hypothetical protein
MVLVTTLFIPVKCAWSIGESGPQFLLISPSVRANGMGEALVATADPSLTYFNPAALGIWSLNNLGAAGWSHGEWLPGFNLEDLWIRQIYASAGYSSRRLMPESPYNVSLGIQYRNHFINYGTTEITNESGQTTGQYHSFEQNHALTAGLGFEYGFELGAGVALGLLRSHLSPAHPGRTTTYDFGVQVRLPLAQMMRKFAGFDLAHAPAPLNLEIAPSLGFAKLDQGNSLIYDGIPVIHPLPKMNRWGTAVELSLKYREWPFFDLLWSVAWSHHMVEKNFQGEAFEIHSQGVEAAFFDVLVYRAGTYRANDGQTSRDTWGITAQTSGLTRAFYEFYLKNPEGNSVILEYLFTHANLQYNYSNMSTSNELLNNTTWWEISISF